MPRTLDLRARGAPKMESVIRDFLARDSKTAADVVKKPPPIDDENEEILRWGGTQDFNDLPNFGFRVVNNQDDEEEEDTGRKTMTYDEVSRQTTTVRVENPDDAEQFVEVERIDTIKFKGSDGQDHLFTLTN